MFRSSESFKEFEFLHPLTLFSCECSQYIQLASPGRSHLPMTTRSPPIIQKLLSLSKILQARPKTVARVRIIAVDGLDFSAVNFLTNYIRYHVAKETGCPVCILCGETAFSPSHEGEDNSSLSSYLRRIQLWKEICESVHLIRVPSIVETSTSMTFLPHAFLSTSTDDPWSTMSLECVYLIPFSPLMTTLKAASRIPITNAYTNGDHWRWLAGHWDEAWRPDITINVQVQEKALKDRDVLRIYDHNMNSLFVIKATVGNILITAKQLRRVMFEVLEWLKEGWRENR